MRGSTWLSVVVGLSPDMTPIRRAPHASYAPMFMVPTFAGRSDDGLSQQLVDARDRPRPERDERRRISKSWWLRLMPTAFTWRSRATCIGPTIVASAHDPRVSILAFPARLRSEQRVPQLRALHGGEPNESGRRLVRHTCKRFWRSGDAGEARQRAASGPLWN